MRTVSGWRVGRPAATAVALVLGFAAVATSQGPAPRPHAAQAAGAGLWVSDSPLDDGRRLLIVIDPATRHAAVYHVDPASGSLTLKSVRDISWDLAVDEFNAQEPRPAALKKMLDAPAPRAAP
jgi:hypothetical protein